MPREERKRVSHDKIRENARQGERGGSFLKLPDGVTEWYPEKAATYSLDIVPYLVTVEVHPDLEDPQNTIWYKRIVNTHRFGQRTVVCPRSVGKKCPSCEDAERLKKKWGPKPTQEQKDSIKALFGKKFILMNMRDPDDRKKIRVFCYGAGKFWSFKGGGLQKEIDEGKEANIAFWDCENGKTLTVRFSEENFGGHNFLQASRFDFEDRPDIDEDKILAKTVDLDKALVILPYEQIQKMMMAVDDEDDKPKKKPADDDEDDDKPRKRSSKDEEDTSDDDPDPDEDDKPRRKSDDDDDEPPTCKEEDCDRPCLKTKDGWSKRCKKHAPPPDDEDDEKPTRKKSSDDEDDEPKAKPCREEDCERDAVKGSKYCKKHQPEDD